MSGRSGVILRHPSGAKKRCASSRRWALAVARQGELTVLFRTDSPYALAARIRREYPRWNTPLAIFDLRDGRFVGERRG